MTRIAPRLWLCGAGVASTKRKVQETCASHIVTVCVHGFGTVAESADGNVPSTEPEHETQLESMDSSTASQTERDAGTGFWGNTGALDTPFGDALNAHRLVLDASDGTSNRHGPVYVVVVVTTFPAC